MGILCIPDPNPDLQTKRCGSATLIATTYLTNVLTNFTIATTNNKFSNCHNKFMSCQQIYELHQRTFEQAQQIYELPKLGTDPTKS